MLSKAQKEWTSRSAQLLSKYNRVDPAESDRVKSELEAAKTELEATRAKITELESSVESLTAQLKTSEADRIATVSKANERGRFAFEFKRKYDEARLKIQEADKKIEEYEKTIKSNETASVVSLLFSADKFSLKILIIFIRTQTTKMLPTQNS